MRKSNWIIVAILVVASIFFLWLWYYLQFDLIDNPLDLVLTVIWWAVVALGCLSIKKAEEKRQERVRTSYIANTAIFNSEAGLVEREAGESAVDALLQVLAGLEYNFDIKDFPSKDEAKFDYVVRSKKFELKKSKDDAAEVAATAATGGTAEVAEVAAEGAQSASEPLPEVKTWEGEVVRVAAPDEDPQEFSSKEELAAILAAA